MIRVLSIAIAASLIAASGASAQEAISTAANAPSAGAPTPASSATTAPISLADKSSFDDRGPLPVGPCGAVAQVNKDGELQKPDKDPHGQVWAGVGTSDYREIGGAVCLPLGDHSALNIAVDTAHIGGGRWRP
jgi:hypothetical protein